MLFPPASGPRASPASVPTSPVGSNSGDPRFLLYEVDFFFNLFIFAGGGVACCTLKTGTVVERNANGGDKEEIQ